MNRLANSLLLLLFIITAANQHTYGQNKTGKTLTVHLREFSDKYKLKISFSPSITDHIYPKSGARSTANNPVEVLTELLKDAGMTFRRVGITYIIIKVPQIEPVVAPVKKSKPPKVIEPTKDTLVVKREPLSSIATAAIPLFELKLPPKRIIRPPITPINTPEPKGKTNWLAIKTNMLYGAYAMTPNLGVEIGLGRRTTLDLSGSYNWFNLNGNNNKNKKRVHWMVQPEFRYFLCERFNGHFFGVHALYSQYNIGGHELPLLLGKGSANFRHEGWAMGGGVTYGYQWMLGKRLNMEFSAGLGYVNLRYDKYDCPKCGSKIDTENKNYFGPTKAAISLIYIIK